MFHILKQHGILHILLAVLCSVVVLIPSHRMNSNGFVCTARYLLQFEICSTWTKKSKKVPVVSYIIRDSLKLKASDADTIVNIHVASEKFAELILLLESNENLETLKEKLDDEYLEIPTDLVKRVFAGIILREIKGFWRLALFISTLVYPEVGNASDSPGEQDELDKRKERYNSVERSITDLDLDGVWKMKPLLDGKAIMGIMQVKSGGPLIGKWQQRLVKWQLAHPEGTMEECMEWMKQSEQQSKRQKIECRS